MTILLAAMVANSMARGPTGREAYGPSDLIIATAERDHRHPGPPLEALP
jgi:hypothetical protein